MLQVVMTYLILAAILFGAAGRLDWGWAWAYLGASLGILLLNAVILPPELIAERGQPDQETIKDWDRTLTRLAALPTLGAPLVAGLDERWGWSPQLAAAVHVLGLVLLLLGQGLFSWAMVSNKHFSTAVRIQQEHAVASGGPYRYVRHPGYTGYIASFVGMALALGSLWALVPVGLVAGLFVARTALEDRTLQDELPGYRDYARRVRYRLLPGVW
jgi:protein-S-isoprenylcysteine O-methyltransferase Ste14